MIIQTKFDIGDKVYFLHENKVNYKVIEKVSTFKCADKSTTVLYELSGIVDRGNFPLKFDEAEVFGTKEELINSL